MYQQLSRYGLTGLIGTAAHYVVMFLLLGTGSSPVFATFVGAIVGACVNFLGCRHWVFNRTSQTVRSEAARFAMTSLLSLAVNTAVVWSLTSFLDVWISQLFATLAAFFLGYLINRSWTFSAATQK